MDVRPGPLFLGRRQLAVDEGAYAGADVHHDVGTRVSSGAAKRGVGIRGPE